MALPVVYENRPWTSTETGAMASRPARHLNPASSSFTPSSAAHLLATTTDYTDTKDNNDAGNNMPSSFSDLAAMFGKLRIKDNSPRKKSESTPILEQPAAPAPAASDKVAASSTVEKKNMDQPDAVGAGPGAEAGVDVHNAATPHAGQNADDRHRHPCLGVKIQHNNPPMKSDVFGALVKNQLNRHLEGQFDFMLKMPEADADADLDAIVEQAKDCSSLEAHLRAKIGTMSPLTTGKLRYFACNVVARQRRSHSGPGRRCPRLGADIVTVVATPLPDHLQPGTTQELKCAQDVGKAERIWHPARETTKITREGHAMALPAPIIIAESPEQEPHMVQTTFEVVDKTEAAQLSPLTPARSCCSQMSNYSSLSPSAGSGAGDNGRCSSRLSLVPLPHGTGRIEDSLEELDMLEDELEAIGALTKVDSIRSPERYPEHVDAAGSVKRLAGTPTAKRTSPPKSSVRMRPLSLIVAPNPKTQSLASPTLKLANRRSIADFSLLKNQATAPSSPKAPSTRPSSLLPPKPLIKSAKAPTVSSFELPGKAVARRLKEQKEARLTQQGSPERASTRLSVRSTKTPTRAAFELPGESLARRRREERAAKLKQEEEERKKREIRAKQARVASTAAPVKPRETIASRARQTRVVLEENTTHRTKVVSTTVTSSKRNSITMTASPRPRQPLTATAVANVPSQSCRGRESLVPVDRTQAIRASSTSTAGASSGSSGSSRSAVSAEDMQAQRLRGKEIVERERLYVEELEQAQRAKEQLARQAREEAADRSRRLSRQWAEKQKKHHSALRTLAAMQ